MALVTEPGGLWMPPPAYYAGTTPAYTSILLDAAADRVACIFYPPKTGAIRSLGFLTRAVPALGGTSTLVFALQLASLTSGDPDEADLASVTISNASIVANTMISGTLSADYTVTDLSVPLAAVVRYGTFNAGDQVNIGALSDFSRGAANYSTYISNNLTGTYAKPGSVSPIVEAGYSDGTYAYTPGLSSPFSALGSTTYNNGSTPDEIGMVFKVVTPRRLGGCWVMLDADGDFNINGYSASAKTVLFSTVDKDVRVATAPGCVICYPFKNTMVLTANTTYAIAVEPATATSLTIYNATVRAAAVMDQMAGGQNWQYATAKNPETTADFTAVATQRALMGLAFDQLDNGVGGGGPLIVTPRRTLNRRGLV